MPEEEPLDADEFKQGAGDEKQVTKAKKKTKIDRIGQLSGLHAILSTYEGRELIWRILSECGLTSQAPFGSAELMNRFEGKRDVGIWMMLEIDATTKIHHTDWYPQMQSEAMTRAGGENNAG